MKNSKKLKLLFITLVLVLSSIPVSSFGAEALLFSDVPSNHWAKNEIYYFESLGIVSGVGDNRFDPKGGVTREQFAAMLVKAFDADLKAPSESSFSDVPNSRWSYIFVETCKEYLTSYRNIFGGKPSFRPTEFATREDITVALVKMMGYSQEEIESSNYASYKFNDADDISPDLFGYVSLAAENNLISGYPDGTFSPNRGITRAEAVVLISKATKTAYADLDNSLMLETEIVESEKEGEIFMTILTELGATVTVDGLTVKTSNNGYDEYQGTYKYTFLKDETKQFLVKVTKQGREVTQLVEYKYQESRPQLVITACPTSVSKKEVTLSGTMFDKRYGVELLINGEYVDSSSYAGYVDNWNEQFILKEGANIFNFVLRNTEGTETTITKTIVYNVTGPILKISACPLSVSEKTVKITGTMFDSNYGTELLINGQSIKTNTYENFESMWSKEFTLVEGQNTFEFILRNTAGKEVRETRVVEFILGGPVLTINSCPTVVTEKNVTITGTMSDINFSQELLINGNSIEQSTYTNYEKPWSESFTLTEGTNTFVFILKNSQGKTTEVTRTIEFTPSAPELVIISCPTLSNSKFVTLSGTMFDKNYAMELLINGFGIDTSTYTNFADSWNTSYELVEGENVLNFELRNTNGKVTTVTRTIIYQP